MTSFLETSASPNSASTSFALIGARAGEPVDGIPYEALTPRELEVLRLAAEGLSNKEIAASLVLSEKTVQNRISNIFAKLRVNDRTQAVLRALPPESLLFC